MTFRNAILFSGAGAFAFLVMSPARADLITNGGFETPVTGNFTDFTAGLQPPGFGWVITSGGVDVVRAGPNFASTAFEGSQFLDLDGFTPGAIAQTFTTTPGTNYLLSFAYANNPEGAGVPSPGCVGACATIPAHAIVSVLDRGPTRRSLLHFFSLTAAPRLRILTGRHLAQLRSLLRGQRPCYPLSRKTRVRVMVASF